MGAGGVRIYVSFITNIDRDKSNQRAKKFTQTPPTCPSHMSNEQTPYQTTIEGDGKRVTKARPQDKSATKMTKKYI